MDERPVRSRTETVRTAAVLVLLLIVAVFAIVNLGQVEVDWIVTTTKTPLIVVIVVSWLLGVLTAFVARRVRRARRGSR